MTRSIMCVARKVFYLASMAVVIGGASAYLLFLTANLILVRKIVGYVVTFSAIGLFGSVTYFMSQIGIVNDAGLMVMIDWSIAARHKQNLVLEFVNISGAQRLWRPIDMEIGAVLLVVLVTVILATAVGPEMDH